MPTARTPRSVILIPVRMGSTRLPGKPLAILGEKPMVEHVRQSAERSAIGPVWVAAADRDIAEAVWDAGGQAVLTQPTHASGSDRIKEALDIIDPAGVFDIVINLQGDLPFLDPALLRRVVSILKETGADIATLATPIENAQERDDPNIVKAVFERGPGTNQGRALYFSRHAVPFGTQEHFQHIGLYAYQRAALAAFVAAPPAHLELQERLEQLRALALGMRIEVGIVAGPAPIGVDTAGDLERARKILANALPEGGL